MSVIPVDVDVFLLLNPSLASHKMLVEESEREPKAVCIDGFKLFIHPAQRISAHSTKDSEILQFVLHASSQAS